MFKLFQINTEFKILLLASILFVTVIGAYAINSQFIYIAFAICIICMLFSYDACNVLIPFSIVVTWGAEIWGIGPSIMYTLLKLSMVGIFLFKMLSKKNNKYHNSSSFFVCLILFILYVLIGDITNSEGQNLMKVLNLFLCYLVIYFYCNLADTKNLELLSFSFGLGTALSACVYWIGFLIPSLNAVVIEMLQTANTFGDLEMGRLSAMTYDPNLYGFFVVVSMALNLCTMYRKKYKHVFWNFILTLFLFVLGMMTLSKAFFLVGGMVLGFFVLLLFRSENVSKMVKGYVAFVIVIAFFAFVYYLGFYFDLFAERFNTDDASDLTTGRSDIWIFYLSYMYDHLDVLLTGASIGGRIEDYSTPHNFIVYLFYFFGIIGTTLYLLMITSLIKGVRYVNPLASRKSSLIMKLPLLTYIVYVLSIDPFMLYDIKIMTLSCCISSLILPIVNYEVKHSFTRI